MDCKKKKIALIVAAGIAVVAYILMSFTPLGVLGLKKENGGNGLFDTMLLYSEDDAYEILDNTTPRGMKLYIQTHIFDYIFMLSLFAAQMLLLNFLLRKNNLKNLKLLYLFPIGQVVADIFEDILLDVMVSIYPKRLVGLVGAINGFSLAKWYFVLGFIITVALVIGVCRKKKKKPFSCEKAESETENNAESEEEKFEFQISLVNGGNGTTGRIHCRFIKNRRNNDT